MHLWWMPTSVSAPSRSSIIIALGTIYLIWGSTYLGIRVAVETMPPFLMVTFRFLIGGVILFPVSLLRGSSWPTASQWRTQAVVGTLLLLGGNAVVTWAEQIVPSGLTTLILSISPVFLVFLDWMRPRGSRPSPGLWLGVAAGFVGIVLLLGPNALPVHLRPPLSCIIALLCSGLCWWTGALYSKHSKNRAEPLMAASMQMLCGSVVTGLAGLALGEAGHMHAASISSRSWIAFGYLVVAGSLIAFPVYAWLLKHCNPALISTHAYVNPIVAVILGWAILGEPLTPRILFAGAAIIFAVALITIQRNRPAGAA